jgi:hypothetical protein
MARIYVDNLGYHRGAVCGGVIAYLLIKVLLKRRNALYGLLYGLAAGFIIGLVNGLLTDTAGFWCYNRSCFGASGWFNLGLDFFEGV